MDDRPHYYLVSYVAAPMEQSVDNMAQTTGLVASTVGGKHDSLIEAVQTVRIAASLA